MFLLITRFLLMRMPNLTIMTFSWPTNVQLFLTLMFVASVHAQIDTTIELATNLTSTATTKEGLQNLTISTIAPQNEIIYIGEATIIESDELDKEEELDLPGESRLSEGGQITSVLPYLAGIFTSKSTGSRANFAGVAVMIKNGKMIIHEKILKVAKDDRQTISKSIKIAYPPEASYDSTSDESLHGLNFKEDHCETYFCILSTEKLGTPGYPWPSPGQLPTLATISDGDLNNDCYLYAWSSQEGTTKRNFVKMPVELKGSCTYGECSLIMKPGTDGEVCENHDVGSPILCQGKLSYIVHRAIGDCGTAFPAYKVASILINKSRRAVNPMKGLNANIPRHVQTRGRRPAMATGRRPAAGPARLAPRRKQAARNRPRAG